MEQLIYGTTAYKIILGDGDSGKLSHAYLVYFADRRNMRDVLKLFALKIFGHDKNSREGRLITAETFADIKVYPKPDKKLNVDDAGEIVEDCVLKPLEGDKKLYVISEFDLASQLFQNKLLKVLEEPPEGVYFLLGAASLAPILPTVVSRVKKLEIHPFTSAEIYCALKRRGDNPLNKDAAESCGGILGEAENMIEGGWFKDIISAAEDIANAKTLQDAADVSLKYGDCKYKEQLLINVQRKYFEKLTKCLSGERGEDVAEKAKYLYAVSAVDAALADVKFNANFPSLLYDFAVRVITENDKWKKLSV